ncbi:hypothetical protein ABZS94_35350, partial [Streptomyces sp. NPDC005500]|uniref:hypothetical protein n=1 Tax=Streptomyces sp. NPDC005500 TaxID=3155007 RepID=UPI0033BC286D
WGINPVNGDSPAAHRLETYYERHIAHAEAAAQKAAEAKAKAYAEAKAKEASQKLAQELKSQATALKAATNQLNGPMLAEQDVCSTDAGQCTTQTATTPDTGGTCNEGLTCSTGTATEAPNSSQVSPSTADTGAGGAGGAPAADQPGGVGAGGHEGSYGAPLSSERNSNPTHFIFAGVAPNPIHAGPFHVSGELVAFVGTDKSGKSYAGFLGAITIGGGPVDVGYGAEWSTSHGVSAISIAETRFDIGPGLSISTGHLGAPGSLSPYIAINPGPLTFGIGTDW